MNDDDLRALLGSTRTIVVVGCSADPSKDAHHVPAWLQQRGFRVIPVNPNHVEILGERAYSHIADVEEPYELVNVFRPSAAAAVVAREAIAAGASAVWLQLGIASPDALEAASAAGIAYVEDRCILVEVERLGIRPG